MQFFLISYYLVNGLPWILIIRPIFRGGMLYFESSDWSNSPPSRVLSLDPVHRLGRFSFSEGRGCLYFI